MTASPEDLLDDARSVRAIKRPTPVKVTFAATAGTITTLEGAVRHGPGAAIVTGGRGERWPVERAPFLASYDALPQTGAGENGSYLKRPVTVLARQLDAPLSVPAGCRGDMLTGRPGDWLLRYPNGTLGVVQADIFAETYKVVPRPSIDQVGAG